MNSFEFASVLLLAFGVYILYACVQLKVSGEPTKGVMVGSRVNLKNAKDMEGFKKYVFKKCLFVGIALVVLALATVGFSFLEKGRWLMIAGTSGGVHLLHEDDFLCTADLYLRAGCGGSETEKESHEGKPESREEKEIKNETGKAVSHEGGGFCDEYVLVR